MTKDFEIATPPYGRLAMTKADAKTRLPRLLRSRRLAMTEGKIATGSLREARNDRGEDCHGLP